MYTQVVADLYSGEWLAVSLYFRSARDSFSRISQNPCGPTVPFGFCCGGFSSTAGLRARQRGPRVRRLASDYRLSSRSIISPKTRLRFYPRRPGQVLRLIPQPKPFGFSAGCNSCNSRLLLLSNDASPYRLPVPSLVTAPVSAATRMWVIRPPFIQVKQKIL